MELEYEIDRLEAQRAIEDATKTGTLDLSKDKLFAYKSFVKKGKKHIDTAFELLLSQLSDNHAQVRLLTFYLLMYTANHSKHGKHLLEERISDIIPLVIGIDGRVLPRPRSFSKVLRKSAIDMLTKFAEENSDQTRLYRVIKHLNEKIVPTLEPITETPYELYLIEQAGIKVADHSSQVQNSIGTTSAAPQGVPSVAIAAVTSEDEVNAALLSNALQSGSQESLITPNNLNRMPLDQFLDRFDDLITRLDEFITRRTSALEKLLEEESRKRDWYKDNNFQNLAANFGAEFLGVDEDFDNMEFIEGDYEELNITDGPLLEEKDPKSRLEIDKMGEVPSSISDTIERFGLGNADYRLEVSVPVNQEVTPNELQISDLITSLQKVIEEIDFLFDIITRRNEMEKEQREFHISRLFEFRKQISDLETRALSFGFKSIVAPQTTPIDEPEKGPGINFTDRPLSSPIKNEHGKRERDDSERGLQFEKKRPRLIKLDSLDAPRSVNEVVEERATLIRNNALKQRNSKRPDSLFGKSINAKKSSFRNINNE